MHRISMLSLVCAMSCARGGAEPSEAKIAGAAAEAILEARSGSAEGELLSEEQWDFVLQEFEWIGDRVPPCTSVEPVLVQQHAHRFRLACAEQELFLRVTMNGLEVESAYFWAADLEPGGRTRDAFDELARLTRTGALESSDPLWSEDVAAGELLAQLPKLRRRGACEVGRLWLGARQHAMYVFDCDKGGAIVGGSVLPDGRFAMIDVDDSQLATWVPSAPQWVPPHLFW